MSPEIKFYIRRRRLEWMVIGIILGLLLSLGLILAMTHVTRPVITGDSDEVLLRAIAQVESNNRIDQTGQAGERGIYQISPVVWYQFTRASIGEAETNPELNQWVARQNIARLRAMARRHGVEPTLRILALAWRDERATHQGFQPSASEADQAQRVLNLMESEVGHGQ